MLGIRNILVAVNKMDLVDYNEVAYQQIREDAAKLLSSFGYAEVPSIPLSALEGDNVFKASERMPWYRGITLIEALDKLEPEKLQDRRLRFAVQDVYALDSEKVVVGRVESGTLRSSDKVIFQPSGISPQQ